ncbi:AprI/Inh family metalloprotease inhibitor [Bosea sp. (in: a-proteobacteria)]|uniref:AprI/Inh family metalloprotease inhibitor n=1 Tax=Bosea sp. (in: a-proteobacteria) TaxID=1871050 RepID=UPI00263725AE|nr:AprI/Inh family metalloprotease inhibitor [Bosea sp. (in: a-proteobacteria)]MCO5090797.1 protease inhibitor Inh/omp19 family protein [Bosea sp. (in: a-proteobacteria)]
MKTAPTATLARAAALVPLLALAACAGSQRFGGGPVTNQPSYGQPALPSAPPISSAPVTSEPLPPPGGYPAASAPPAGAPLPGPEDPFFDPSVGGAAQGQPLPQAGQQPEQLRGGGGQIATLGQSPTTAPRPASRDNMVGGWTAREATGGSCRVQLSSTPALDLYRASSSGCANKDLQKISAWDFRDGEVYLYQQGGTVAARLRSSGSGALDGAVTKSGASLSMSR